jgi:hypothetical protein
VNQVTLKELARLKFGPLSEADREVYRDVRDEDALIAYSHDKTFIIESDLLRVVQVRQRKLKVVQQYFNLEAWGDHSRSISFEADAERPLCGFGQPL